MSVARRERQCTVLRSVYTAFYTSFHDWNSPTSTACRCSFMTDSDSATQTALPYCKTSFSQGCGNTEHLARRSLNTVFFPLTRRPWQHACACTGQKMLKATPNLTSTTLLMTSAKLFASVVWKEAYPLYQKTSTYAPVFARTFDRFFADVAWSPLFSSPLFLLAAQAFWCKGRCF